MAKTKQGPKFSRAAGNQIGVFVELHRLFQGSDLFWISETLEVEDLAAINLKKSGPCSNKLIAAKSSTSSVSENQNRSLPWKSRWSSTNTPIWLPAARENFGPGFVFAIFQSLVGEAKATWSGWENGTAWVCN